MFSNFLDVLQGPSVEATDEKGSEASSHEVNPVSCSLSTVAQLYRFV